PQPQPPHPANAQHCVLPTPEMRRDHMKLLLQGRDMTVHQGLRGQKYSLEGCVNCHTVRDEHGQPVGYDDPRHFCRSCHGYAAVKIDCFECHSSKPTTPAHMIDWANVPKRGRR
ncbi:MAG: hypothetical protein KGQ42_06610, partial [Alphaproteobacteria bacterium]|nr:hypothetical protein [Alphaproteobacteria bacterium]